MKVNLKRDFVDCFGEQLKQKVVDPKSKDGIKEEVLTVWKVVASKLYNLSTLYGVGLKPEVKYNAYQLCNRIIATPEAVELSVEEASFIKEVAGEQLSAGAYGLVVDLIEKGENNV